MKKYLFFLAAVVLSSAVLSCSSYDEEENKDETKQVMNMPSKP